MRFAKGMLLIVTGFVAIYLGLGGLLQYTEVVQDQLVHHDPFNVGEYGKGAKVAFLIMSIIVTFIQLPRLTRRRCPQEN